MKERLRVVTSSRQHKETKEVTDVQVKEAADKKLKQIDGDFPVCMRREKDDNENKARRNNELKGKGGGRLKLCNVDGDVPLCLRSFDEENKDSSSKKRQRRQDGGAEATFRTAGRMTAEAKRQAVARICAAILLKKKTRKWKNKRKRHHIHRATKNMRSIHSSERIEDMICELEGYRWDVIMNERNLEARQVRHLGNTPETHIHGSRKI